VWMSNDGPRCFIDMAEHSMCQPGRPLPIAVSHDGSPGFGPSRPAKSRTSSLAYSSLSTRSPDASWSGSSPGEAAVGRPRRDPEEDRAVVGAVGVPPAIEVEMRSTISGMWSVAAGRTSGRSSGAARRREEHASQRSASSRS
jgi:hypothetical protein